jgi:hypothetical protein
MYNIKTFTKRQKDKNTHFSFSFIQLISKYTHTLNHFIYSICFTKYKILLIVIPLWYFYQSLIRSRLMTVLD